MIKTQSFKFLQVGLLSLVLLSVGCKVTSQGKKADGRPDGFVQIFDGKTLKGWEGDPVYWRVENGNLVGEITPSTLLKTNSFIIWKPVSCS